MNCTLQERCEVGVAIDICNDPEIKKIIFTSSKHLLIFTNENNNNEEFETWLSTFFKEISHVFDNFPNWLLGKIKYLIPVISIEMLKWARFHKETFLLSFEFSKDFISRSLFTATGIIDKEKAARALMEEKSLRPSTLFWIGSYYGLTDEALKFWTQVPDFEIPSLRSGNTAVVWVDFLLGHNKGTNFLNDVLKTAVDNGSELSFCYHWKKLDEEGKKEAANYFAQTFFKKLKLWNKNRKCVDFMYVCEPYIEMFKCLVQDLDIAKIKILLNEHELTYLVLSYLLHWPYQSSFLDTVKLIIEILSKQSFYYLLLDIILKVDDPFVAKLYDYRNLFGKFWKESCEDFKISLFSFEAVYLESDDLDDFEFYFGSHLQQTHKSFGYLILLKLFNLDFTNVDEQNVRSLFVSIELPELRRIELAYGKDLCNACIKNGKLRCADLFLECCKVANLVDFKRNFFNTVEYQITLENLLQEFKLDLIDETLKWALNDKEFVMFKQKLCSFMSINIPLKADSEFITLSYEGSEFSHPLNINLGNFVVNFKLWLFDGEFDKADKFLEWIFSSPMEIHNYKSELAREWSKTLDIVSEWAGSKYEFQETKTNDINLRKNILIFSQRFRL